MKRKKADPFWLIILIPVVMAGFYGLVYTITQHAPDGKGGTQNTPDGKGGTKPALIDLNADHRLIQSSLNAMAAQTTVFRPGPLYEKLEITMWSPPRKLPTVDDEIAIGKKETLDRDSGHSWDADDETRVKQFHDYKFDGASIYTVNFRVMDNEKVWHDDEATFWIKNGEILKKN